jgi:hypothetical protein
MKIAISIPDALFKAAERMARCLGISRSQLFQRAVQQYIGEQQKLGVTETLDQIYGGDPSASRVDPVLNGMQLASLPQEEW